MSAQRTIKARELVADIRSRVSDFELMEKYQLTFAQLEKVLAKLVEKDALRQEELQERGAHFDNPENRVRTRRAPREYLMIPLPIQQTADPSIAGFITDLSEQGFRAKGLATALDEKNVFVIGTKDLKNYAPFTVEAVCRWTRFDFSQDGQYEAGFEILEMSKRDRLVVRKMMEELGLGDRNIMKPKSSSR